MSQNNFDIKGIQNLLSNNYFKTIIHLLKSNHNISAEQFIESCLNSIKRTPKLLQCDTKSLFGAMMHCAEVGLKPDTPDQHCFLIPRYNRKTNRLEANFEIGYKGLIEIMYRNPSIVKVFPSAVYENDTFDYEYGLEPNLVHKPFRGEDRGGLDAVYCFVKFDNGEKLFTVVEKHELAKIEGISANQTEHSAYNNGKDVFNFMQIKVAIKKISKILPKNGNEEIAKAIEIDSKLEGGASTYIDIPSSDDQIVVPTLIEQKASSLTSTFDDSEDVLSQVKETQNNDKIIANPNGMKKGDSKNLQNAFDEISFETNVSKTPESKEKEVDNSKMTESKLFDFDDDDDDDDDDDYDVRSNLF